MSKLLASAEVDPAAWNDSVSELGGTVFHAAEWAASTVAEQPGARPVFYTMLDGDGSVSGLALGFRQTSKRSITAAFSGRRWLDALPVVRDGDPRAISRFVGLIENDARLAGDVTLRIGSFASPTSEQVLAPLGYSLAGRYEFELDLTRDEKSLWDDVDIKRRQRIRKAMKAGVEVREVPVDDGVFHLRRLQEASFERITARGGPALHRKTGRPDDPMTALISRGLGRIVGAFVDGECVSAGFFSTFNGLAYYALSGHDSKALTSQAPSLLLWEMLLRFQREGFRRLNLGGCGAGALEESSPEHGVYTYKKAFGGTQFRCASGEKILRPTVRRVTNLLRNVVR